MEDEIMHGYDELEVPEAARHTVTQRLSAESAKWRKSFREAQVVIEEQNRMLLGVWLRGRLVDPGDFHVWIRLDSVVGADGRINWSRTSMLVDELLTQKPHLGAPEGNPWAAGTRAIDWFTTGTD
jgi:hypothetical protein